MADSHSPIILGIDEDRAAQKTIAQAFNEQGVFYRFVTDRQKVIGGIKQLKPQLLLLFGELESNFVIQVLDVLSSDATAAQRPVVVVCSDTSASPFVQGMRTGVVSILAAPFNAAHVGTVRALYDEVSTRTGNSAGTADATTLRGFVEHIRRTRRSGVLRTNARMANEARASFIYGKLDKASFLGAPGQHALNALLNQPPVRWTFTEIAGAHNEGTGVVIEVGDIVTGEVAVAEMVIEQDEPLAFEVPPQKAEAPQTPFSGPPPQLMLVDDDEAILQMCSTLFRKHGFAVTTATNGKEGAEIALQRAFDVVLADLNMPHLDGWGMLRSLREDFRTRELPIAFLSAHEDYRESLRALDAGAQAYLSKGTKLDIIVRQVIKLLEPRRALLAMLDVGHTESIAIHSVGPQWLLRTLSARRLSGLISCRDGWAAYQLGFSEGVCTHASALAGKYTAQGERAFNAFVASRAGEGAFIAKSAPDLPQNLYLPTEVLIERACAVLNENERRMRESLMVSATQVEVNSDLYDVYRAVAPAQWREAARLVCEESVAPREIIARLQISPIEVEECMKDLIRRGVMSLKQT